jgi:hypothetical protein
MKYLTIVFLLIFHFACLAQNVNETEKCQLYMAIIKQYGDKSEKYLIRETTNSYKINNSLQEFKPEMFFPFFSRPPIDSLYFPLFDKYTKLANRSENIKEIILQDTSKRMEVFTDLEYQDIFTNKNYQSIRQDFGFEELRRRHPETFGYYAFSPIIFSGDKQHAICYLETLAASKGGAGFLVFMEKAISKWRIKYLLHLWEA